MARSRVAQPVAAGERIMALDVMRGFAMLGVLIAYCAWSLGTAPESQWTAADKMLGDVIAFLVDGKFYTILAFLFGYGFSIQLSRAREDSAAIQLYCRRFTALAAIGLAHAMLLRNGDILLPYALTGLLLIPFRRSSDRVLMAAAAVALLIPFGAKVSWAASGNPIPQRPDLSDAPYLVENAAWVSYWYSTAIFSWPLNLTLFLFGLAAGRRKLLSRASERQAALIGLAAAGLAGAGAFWIAHITLARPGSTPAVMALATLMFTFHCWGMSTAYVASLLLALRARPGQLALAPLAAIGRMALTNYLMQALLIVPLCLAFGLFDTFTPTKALVLSAAVFVLIQIPFSLVWLRSFHFGPAEWAWRLLTYGELPPLRRTANEFGTI